MSVNRAERTPEEEELLHRQRLRKEKLEEKAAATQARLGVAAAVAGIGLISWTVVTPSVISAILAGGVFIAGIGLAVPGAQPYIIRILELIPWVDTTSPEPPADPRP